MRSLTVEEAYDKRWWTLGVLCASLSVISIDNTILNVALPHIVDDLGASGSDLQWIVDAYVVVFAGLLLTSGALGDKFGRKRMLVPVPWPIARLQGAVLGLLPKPLLTPDQVTQLKIDTLSSDRQVLRQVVRSGEDSDLRFQRP